jgi:hypothetical protein
LLLIASSIPLLLETLADLEARYDDRARISKGMSEMLILLALGRDWFDKHVYDSDDPDPWMLNGTPAWFESHSVPAPDIRPIIHANRVARLGDALFTVISNVRDSERLKQRFLTRRDTRATFTETEIASLLAWNGCSVRVIGESGVRGQDFDLAATTHGVEVSVEVTAMEGHDLTIGAIYNKLKHKQTQVRSDRPAVLFVRIPAMRSRAMAEIIKLGCTSSPYITTMRVSDWRTLRCSPLSAITGEWCGTANRFWTHCEPSV